MLRLIKPTVRRCRQMVEDFYRIIDCQTMTSPPADSRRMVVVTKRPPSSMDVWRLDRYLISPAPTDAVV
jgi:hypothetical protein